MTGANSGGVCQCYVAGLPRVAVRLVDESNSEAAVRFLGEWLCEGESPAQRTYGLRGYIPDGRGACQGQRPLTEGMQVRLDHDVIIWLTKDITTVHAHRPPS